MSTLDPLFRPRSVAIIGASTKELSIGNRIIRNLQEYKFTGPIYPINPKADEVRGIKAYPGLLDVPGEIDLVHIVIPNKFVPIAMEDCGKKGVKAVIVNTAGFKEIGPEGAELEKQVVEVGRKYGMRVFGPNCQGIINSDPEISAYCNFTFTPMREGKISVLAQSGGVGEVINNRLFELDAGVRLYASNGNACDISLYEILEYYGNDEGTKAIILHIESFSDPQEFMRIAKEITKKKPLLAMKSGKTSEGLKAVCSHTGTLMKSDVATDLMFEKCGILSFYDHEEICQVALGLASQPGISGDRVGIIENTGGPGIIATDYLVQAGMSIPELGEETKAKLREGLFPEAAVNNPVDVLATARPEHWSYALKAMLECDDVDSIMLCFVTPFFVDTEGVANEIKAAAADAGKPIVCNLMTNKGNWGPTIEIMKSAGIPLYDFSETAAKALIAMRDFTAYQNRAEPVYPEFEVDSEKAKGIISGAAGKEMLSGGEVFELLKCYGIPAAGTVSVPQAEVVSAASGLNYPVVLKIDDEAVVHKTDEGGVALGLQDDAALNKALDDMASKFGEGKNYVVQEYLKPGKEVIMGATNEGKAGHVIMFGLGGIFVEVLKDVVFKLNPVSETDADSAIKAIKGYPILEGIRGQEGVDVEKLKDVMLRLSKLLADNPDIQELDLNPVFAYADDAKVVDARIRI